jgi:hypothetical protein
MNVTDKKVLWQGTVDLTNAQELGHMATQWPMRIVEDLDGDLQLQFAAEEQIEEGRCVPNVEEWETDYQRPFRDCVPEIPTELYKRVAGKFGFAP